MFSHHQLLKKAKENNYAFSLHYRVVKKIHISTPLKITAKTHMLKLTVMTEALTLGKIMQIYLYLTCGLGNEHI